MWFRRKVVRDFDYQGGMCAWSRYFWDADLMAREKEPCSPSVRGERRQALAQPQALRFEMAEYLVPVPRGALLLILSFPFLRRGARGQTSMLRIFSAAAPPTLGSESYQLIFLSVIVHLSLSACLSICLCLPLSASVCLPACFVFFPSIRLSVCLPACLSVGLFGCLACLHSRQFTIHICKYVQIDRQIGRQRERRQDMPRSEVK